MNRVVAVILGGGAGTRLFPLTRHRAKPAVPLAGKYRLVDVPVSNCINSGLDRIYLSMDGLTKETYEKVRVKGKFEEVRGNIERLIDRGVGARVQHLQQHEIAG